MFAPLKIKAYRRLFSAQIFALLGTGLATIALALLAHDLAGGKASQVIGAVLVIKMTTYVVVAPFASALTSRLPHKTLLIGLDLIRCSIALFLPFVSDAWQVYALMTGLYVTSAAFTPAFQAMIPDLLPDEETYTQALSLSRLASDLESVASPVLAALLLIFLSWSDLFAGTAAGFAISAIFVALAPLPNLSRSSSRPFLHRLRAGGGCERAQKRE